MPTLLAVCETHGGKWERCWLCVRLMEANGPKDVIVKSMAQAARGLLLFLRDDRCKGGLSFRALSRCCQQWHLHLAVNGID